MTPSDTQYCGGFGETTYRQRSVAYLPGVEFQQYSSGLLAQPVPVECVHWHRRRWGLLQTAGGGKRSWADPAWQPRGERFSGGPLFGPLWHRSEGGERPSHTVHS